jgi:tRNA (guanosine-2'-O-)-methyltransferase
MSAARSTSVRTPAKVRQLRGLAAQRDSGTAIVGVELAEGAVRLADGPRPHRGRARLRHGIPDAATAYLDCVVEIPMLGTGVSLTLRWPARWSPTSWPG